MDFPPTFAFVNGVHYAPVTIGLCVVFSAMALAEPKAEFIFETAPFQRSHASTLIETKDGDLLVAWFGGTAEGNKDVAIWTSRRQKKGWSPPKQAVREPNMQCRNPVLFRTMDGVIWLSYKFGPSAMEWTGGFCTSRDEGRTWSAPRHLPAGLYGPIKNKPLVLPDGTVVAGTSVESYKAWSCWVERSTDNGRTWSKHGPIVHPEQPYGIIQPTIVPIADNRLRMFVRSKNIGKICYADSSDGGRTWTKAKETTLPNPNAGIDAVALKDGRIVLVYNHSRSERTPLNVAVSNDDGETWNSFLKLETKPGRYGYPAVIQTADGNIHITYSWKRERIRHVEIPLQDVP